MDSIWTAETIAQVSRLWGEGYSAGAIGGKLGISRCAIIAKMGRLGVKQGERPAFDPAKTRITNARRGGAVIKTVEPDPEPPPPETATLFLELRPRQCRYAVGRADGRAEFFCGAVTQADSAYCAYHHRICYRGTPTQIIAAQKAARMKTRDKASA